MTGISAPYLLSGGIRVSNSQVIKEAADHEEIEDGEAVLTPGDKIDFLFF